ncbi:MAG: RNA polymerase sigma-70 factor [Solirubrobacteraceae bacterium]
MSAETEALLAGLRPRAFSIAYRMLGSVSDAEDVVQEALLRVHAALAAGERLESPPAYAATVVTRLAIDQLRSARVRRERYVGEWLPEPIVAEDEAGPADEAELADSLSLAFLVVLERLTPEQRAVLLLRDVFDYRFAEVATIVGRSEPAVRQLAVRARRAIEEGRPRFETSREQRTELAHRFFAAAREGDLAQLEALLAGDVVLHGDGGGKAPALARPVEGRARVARTLLAWVRAGARIAGAVIREVTVNGEPGAMLLDGEGRVISVIGLEISGGQVRSLRSIVNPDKLAHLGEVADVSAHLGR